MGFDEIMRWIKTCLDPVILTVLGTMSLVALTFVIERLICYRRFDVQGYEDIKQLETDLTKNLTVLSIISTNAPYVGLLGTVLGIMITFYDMGSGGIDTKAILKGLSSALYATALGLLVAIPTLVAYSSCLRKVDVYINKWKSLKNAS